MKDTYLNLACYQFADLDDLPALRAHLLTEGRRLDMRGTILLTTEGVNVMLSGLEANARAFAAVLRAIPGLEAMHIKESRSAEHGFNRFLVKIKKETITFRQPGIRPADGRAATVSPETLARWLDDGRDDDGRDVVIIDTRNDFEVQVGHFHNAINPHISKFTELPAALEAHRPQLAGKRIVTYCTGGIRCEKAALWMDAHGYENVVQLDAACWTTSSTPAANTGMANCSCSTGAVSVTTDLQPGSWEQDFGSRTVRQRTTAATTTPAAS